VSKLRLQSSKENETSHHEKGENCVEVTKGAIKKKECPLCGGHEWIEEVKGYVLHNVRKHCGFESRRWLIERNRKF